LDPGSDFHSPQWRYLTLFDEYLFLTQIVPSLLYWAAEGKALRLNEAFEQAGKDAEMQRPAQNQESLSMERKRSGDHNEIGNSKRRISKRSRLNAVQVKKRSGNKYYLLVT
jgi:hypothetical protein